MKLIKLTFAVLLVSLMFPLTFGQDPNPIQVKSEKRVTPKPPPPPVAPVPKKPRQDDDLAKEKMKGEGNEAGNESQPASAASRKKTIPNETEPRR